MTDKNENLELARGHGALVDEYIYGKTTVAFQLDEFLAFAAAIESRYQAKMASEGWRQCAKDQSTSQFCGQAEELSKKMVMLEKKANIAADCLHDIGSGYDGWAWEEVESELREALSATQPDTDAFLAGVRAEERERCKKIILAQDVDPAFKNRMAYAISKGAEHDTHQGKEDE